MPKIQILNQRGENVGELELNETIFSVDINKHVVYEVVKNQLANKRQGTQSAKTRSETRSRRRRPWRQKGTNRARQGSIRSPQWRDGGVVFAPKPGDYSYAVPEEVKRLAVKPVLAERVNDNEMTVLDRLNLDAISTRKVVEVLKNVKADKKVLVIIDKNDDTFYRSFGNIENVAICEAKLTNIYDCLRYNSLVITVGAVKILEEVFQ